MTALFEHGYALIVGVDDNLIGSLALPAVAHDVKALQDVLLHPQRCAYNPDNVKLLYGPESTRDNILAAFTWLQDKVKEDADATTVIYYSGHGMVDETTNSYYLIPYDMDVSGGGSIFDTALRAEVLAAEISAVNTRRNLIILDCCHAAGMDAKRVDSALVKLTANSKAAAFPDLPEIEEIPLLDVSPGAKSANPQLRQGEGRAVLNSSTGAESSYVRPGQDMSVFTYHLIEALTGHASSANAEVVNVAEVMGWVTNKVRESARAIGQSQTPVMRTSGVFPVALVVGGQGIAKGMRGKLPNPLEHLSPSAATFNQQGQTVKTQVNTGDNATIGRIGDTTVTKKKKVDKSRKVDKSKKEGGVTFNASDSGSITVDGPIAGRDQQNTTYHSASDRDELAKLITPLLEQARQQNQAAAAQVQELQAELTRGEQADDEKVADLVGDIADAAPAVVETLVGLFSNSIVSKAAGAGTKAVLRLIQRNR